MPPDPPLAPPPACTTADCPDHGKLLERIGTVQDDKGRPFHHYGCPSCLQKTMRSME